MSIAVRLDLDVERALPFRYVVKFEGENFSNTILSMQVRLYPDQPGAPLLNITNAALPADGLTVTTPARADGTIDTFLTINITSASTRDPSKLPFPRELGDVLKLHYDLIATKPGDFSRKRLFGFFNVLPAVTQ